MAAAVILKLQPESMSVSLPDHVAPPWLAVRFRNVLVAAEREVPAATAAPAPVTEECWKEEAETVAAPVANSDPPWRARQLVNAHCAAVTVWPYAALPALAASDPETLTASSDTAAAA